MQRTVTTSAAMTTRGWTCPTGLRHSQRTTTIAIRLTPAHPPTRMRAHAHTHPHACTRTHARTDSHAGALVLRTTRCGRLRDAARSEISLSSRRISCAWRSMPRGIPRRPACMHGEPCHSGYHADRRACVLGAARAGVRPFRGAVPCVRLAAERCMLYVAHRIQGVWGTLYYTSSQVRG